MLLTSLVPKSFLPPCMGITDWRPFRETFR
jgi:hypothetical protein